MYENGMTKEEAIEIIKETTIWCWHDRRAELREALDLAIEALQKEKDDDCVSKEWLINEIARRDTTDGTVKVFDGREINEIILNAPSVTPTINEDCISRADAIEAVHKYFVDLFNDEPYKTDEDGDDVYTDMKSVNEILKHNKHISKAIKALPPVTPTERTGEWIPCEYVYKYGR